MMPLACIIRIQAHFIVSLAIIALCGISGASQRYKYSREIAKQDWGQLSTFLGAPYTTLSSMSILIAYPGF